MDDPNNPGGGEIPDGGNGDPGGGGEIPDGGNGPGGGGVPGGGNGGVPDDGTGQNTGGGPTNLINNSCGAWDATKNNMLRVLGFDVGQGPVVVDANTPTSAPGILDLSSRQYVLMKLKINDSYVGELYELDCESNLQGPFFSKILLINSSLDALDFSYLNSGEHTFGDVTTIKTIQVELYDPLTGKDVTSDTVLSRHNSRGRDNELDLFIIP